MVQTFLTHFGYAAVFLVLLGAGMGLPFPEEVTQLTAGFLARQGTLAFWPALAVCWIGIVTGDYLLFRLGRRHGVRVLASRRLQRIFTPERRRWVERHFASHDFLTIAIARHASGLRLPVFATAGAVGVRTSTFLLADGLSALVSVPLVVSLGYFFASQLETVRHHIRQAELIGLALLLTIGLIWSVLRRRRGPRVEREDHPEPGQGGGDGPQADVAPITPPAGRGGRSPRRAAP
ncbi:MAG TPA: DedA family protein [Anaeromyxobacteraceae bacterium]|nr:DedA family protein [Anaeromyxobacteraceae bacterium]